MNTDEKPNPQILEGEEFDEFAAAIRGGRWARYQYTIKMFGKEEADRAFAADGGIPEEPRQ